jgi:hypothetical protein
MAEALKSPEEYREMADNARQRALRTTDPDLRRTYQQLTKDYEMLADSVLHLRAMRGRIRGDSKL